MKKKTKRVNINTIARRLWEWRGIRYERQGDQIILCAVDNERDVISRTPCHWSCQDISELVACGASTVLQDGERIADKYKEV